MSGNEGIDTWYENKHLTNGIQRGYRRHHDPTLKAEWKSKWYMNRKIARWCVTIVSRYYTQRTGSDAIYGDDDKIYREEFYNTPVFQPRKLKPNFFGNGNPEQCGTVAVGVARRMNNPLQFFVRRKVPGERGIFNAFTLNEDERFMWSASAARAGYRFGAAPPASAQNDKGCYQTTYWTGGGVPTWNIRWSDWDAVMLPLCRGWIYGQNNAWSGGDSTGEILSEMSAGSWEKLYTSGGDLGDQTGPKGMNEGSPASFGGMDGYGFH
jgi:hypothetical protein